MLVLLVVTITTTVVIPRAQTPTVQTTVQESKQLDVREIKVGEPIERELSGGEAQSYRVMLTAGQYVKVVVEQKGIDVVVRLFTPDGKTVTAPDNPNRTQGQEGLSTITESVGEYRLEVKPRDDKAAGRYEIKLRDVREATTKDRDRIAAELALVEAERSRVQGTPESLRKSLDKYDEALTHYKAIDDRDKVVFMLNVLGQRYREFGDSQKALRFHNEAVLLARAMGDRRREGETLYFTGVVYWGLGDSQKALDYYNQGLPLLRAAGDRLTEGRILGATGTAYENLGKLHEALDSHNQALVLHRAAGNRISEATTLSNIGVSYFRMGEWQEALDYHNQALSLVRELKDRRLEAQSLTNIGFVYWQLGENQKALEYYNQALPLRRAAGDRSGEASTLSRIGAIHEALGDGQKALEYFNQALTLSRAVGDRRGESNALMGIGVAYRLLGETQKALDFLNPALVLRQAAGDRLNEAVTLDRIGTTYSTLGQHEEATRYFEQALSLQRLIGARSDEAETLAHLARAEQARGRFAVARTQIEAALNIVESMRSKFVGQQLRTSFSASTREHYDEYINVLMRMHQKEPLAGHEITAFGASERARARSLLELLAEARIDIKQGIAPDLKQREKDVQSRISRTQNQLIQASSSAKPDQTKVTALEEQFKKLETEREQLEIELRQRHPRYATLHYPRPLDLKAVQKLLDENTVLLEYSLGQEASYLFAITRNDFLTARLPAASVITKQVTALREAVAVRPDRTALPNYFQNARSLYRDLVQPAGKLLNGKRGVIIVPDGILHYLPFESLLETDGVTKTRVNLRQLPYMIRNFTISYAPSATVLASLRKERVTATSGKSLLAFGDPIYEQKDFEQTAPIRSALRGTFDESKPWELKQLPESRHEVERIAKLYAPAQASVFLGESAREENVKVAGGPGYRFVHFAVHGLLNEKQPQYSGLVLSLSRINKEAKPQTASMSDGPTDQWHRSAVVEDGLLQVYEIFDLKLDTDLVVLSACETGLGKETKGEGLVGMTQAFLYAGTPSVAVSLWKVEDRSTSDLMFALYRHLNNPRLNKADALRRAQLEMISKGDFTHPYYWAGFVLIGQP